IGALSRAFTDRFSCAHCHPILSSKDPALGRVSKPRSGCSALNSSSWPSEPLDNQPRPLNGLGPELDRPAHHTLSLIESVLVVRVQHCQRLSAHDVVAYFDLDDEAD